MGTQRTCPSCRKPLPENTPGGLCPECLMKAGFGTGVAPEAGQPSKAPAFIPPPVTELAKCFPQLEILGLLGQGGMGAVYKARQPVLDRLVALKILPTETANDPGFAERFTREARSLARLDHPNIVGVHDFGQSGGFHYFLMEFVDGANLRQIEQAGKLTAREALQIIPQICEALQFAHDEGIVHRDIKPENILVDKRGRVKIADFGIAKILGLPSGKVSLTGAKDVIGTPHYMAPEQVEKPATVDHRADIYSLGVVFYEMLTGELPLGKFQPPSKKVQVDVRLDEVVLHALEKEPDRRYQHASEVKTDVETIASSPATERATSSSGGGGGDAGRLTTSFLPNLLPGERVLHVKRLVWAMFIKSLPNFRLFFSLPPLWEAGMYVTDRRILHVWAFFRLLALEFSVWFSGKAQEGKTELFKEVSTGKSRCFGEYLDIKSETPRKRWYRSHELLLRIYTREAGALQRIIASASDAGSSRRQEAQTESAGDGASPGRSASAATTGKKPWISFCLAITFAGALLIGALYELLFRHVSGGWLIGIFILLACASAVWAFVLEDFATAETQRVCFKAGAWLAFIAPLPLFGLGVFFLNALLSERGGWHPNPAEAVIVPLVWLGALLLPVCGWRLLRAAGQPLGDAWIIFSIIVAVVMMGLGIPVVYWTSNRQHKEQQYEKEVAQEIARALPQLRSEDVKRRRSAAMDLYSLGTGAKGAVPELLRALKDSDGLVRMFAASALGYIGTNAGPAAASALSRALEDPDQRVRFSAAEALGSVDLQTTANLAVLMDRLTNRPSEDYDSWPIQRREAVTALGKMGARAAPALPVLRAVERDLDVKSAIEQIEQAGKKSKRGFFGLFQSEAAQSVTSQVVGDPRYEPDRRTCVIKAKFEAGRTYAFWLNSEDWTTLPT